MNRRISPLSVVFLTVVIDLVGFGIILPLMPLYARRFGAGEAMVAVLFASYSVGQFLFAPLWGRLSDRIGRRPVLLFSILGNAIALAVFGGASTFWGLLVARTIAGVCTANISVANAYVADVSPPEMRAKRMGLIGAAFGIGFVIGPFIGGELTRFGASAPPYFAAAMALLNFVSALFLLPESLPAHKRREAPERRLVTRLSVMRLVPGVGTLVGLGFFQIAAFSMLEMAFTLFLNDRLGYEEKHAGRVFAYIGVVMVVVQGGLIGALARRFGEVRLVRAGLLTIAFAMLLMTQIPSGRPPLTLVHLGMLALFVTLIASGQGIMSPSLNSLLSRRTPADLQGAALGLSQSLGALARVVGPLTAGVLYTLWGENYPFLVGGILMAGAWLLAVVWLEHPVAAQPAYGVRDEV